MGETLFHANHAGFTRPSYNAKFSREFHAGVSRDSRVFHAAFHARFTHVYHVRVSRDYFTRVTREFHVSVSRESHVTRE